MSKTEPITSVSSVLSGVLKKLKAQGRPTSEEIQEVWQRLAGQAAAQHSWPRSLQKGRLLVEVDNSGWMYTLGLKKTQLLQGLIELLGANRVTSLSFRMGEEK